MSEIAVTGFVISLLLGTNAFFIKRLVDKIDHTSRAGDQTSISVTQLTQTVNSIGNQLREIKSDIKDLRRVEIEVAILKAQLNNPSQNDG